MASIKRHSPTDRSPRRGPPTRGSVLTIQCRKSPPTKRTGDPPKQKAPVSRGLCHHEMIAFSVELGRITAATFAGSA